MDTLIKILKLSWPLIKEGLLGDTKVQAYLSRRKYTTFMVIACSLMLAALSFMTDQAKYYKGKYVDAKNNELALVKRLESLTDDHNNCKDIHQMYKDELLRLNNTYDIESPLIIKRGVIVKEK